MACCPCARLGSPTKAPSIKAWKLREAAIEANATMDQHAVLLRTQPHQSWERHYLLGFAMVHPIKMDGLVCTFGGEGTIQSPLESHCPLSCCKLDLLKRPIPGMKHVPLKEGRRWGSSP